MSELVRLTVTSTHVLDVTAKTSPTVTVVVKSHTAVGQMHMTTGIVVNAGAHSTYIVTRDTATYSDATAVASSSSHVVDVTARTSPVVTLSYTRYSNEW